MRFFDHPLARESTEPGDEEQEDFSNPCHDEWTYGVTQEEQEELYRLTTAPKPGEWKVQPVLPITVSVDRARVQVGKQADKEFEFLKSKLQAAGVILEGEDMRNTPRNVITSRLAKWIFGPESSLFRLFEVHVPCVKHNFPLFARCVAAFFYCCRYDESLEKLKEPPTDSDRGVHFREAGLPTTAEYKQFLKEVSKAGLQPTTGRGMSEHMVGEKPFWKHLESELNNFLRLYTIVGRTEVPIRMIIDDDKVHRSSAYNTPRLFLKEQQHVRDNRRGFTNHQIVHYACQILAGIALG